MKPILLSAFILSISAFAQNDFELHSAKIDSVVSGFTENAQLSYSFVTPEETLFYGVLNHSSGLMQIENQDSSFEIASITKVFTSLVLSNYIQQEKLDPNDKINAYIPFKIKKKITFKQLANHTSGLPRLPETFFEEVKDLEDPYAFFSTEALEQYLSEGMNLISKPGKQYAYSNLGAGILGYTLSKIEGISYKNLVKSLILEKYEMSNSGFDPENFKNTLTVPYTAKGKKCKNWNWDPSLIAAGGLISTSRDMSKFIRAHFDKENKELFIVTIPTLRISENMSMGLGWHIVNTGGSNILWHNGRSGGYTSSMIIDLENKKGLVLLSNQTKGNLDDLAFELINL